MEFNSFGFSDLGRVHNHNEDSFICNKDERLFLVADGMGGHVSGETASKLAVDTVEAFVINSRAKKDLKWPIEYRKGLRPEQNRLLAAAFQGNRRIHEKSMQDPSLKGMGTTLVGSLIDGDNLVIVNVGDSRLYMVRNNILEQLTKDHSLVGEQERKGILTRKEARHHPQKHILTNALGHLSSSSKIDILVTGIMPKDIYLICTDGLYNMIDDDKILEIINSIKDRSLYKIGLSLALQANLAGGLDNITVVLISF
jgi:serine/threonine protein phosphatase PrpC